MSTEAPQQVPNKSPGPTPTTRFTKKPDVAAPFPPVDLTEPEVLQVPYEDRLRDEMAIAFGKEIMRFHFSQAPPQFAYNVAASLGYRYADAFMRARQTQSNLTVPGRGTPESGAPAVEEPAPPAPVEQALEPGFPKGVTKFDGATLPEI